MKNIPLVHDEDIDYVDYNTPNTSRVDETSFTMPGPTDKETTLRLTQKVKKDKLAALYRHLNVTGNLDLINIDRFRLTTDPKKGATVFEFYNGLKWVSLTKQTAEFFAPKTLGDRFGRVNAMKNFLGIDETPPALEKSFKAVTKLRRELPTDIEMESIPLMELSSLAENIHVKVREASHYTDFDMREFLGIAKASQTMQGELVNNTSKLTETNEHIKKRIKS